MSIHLNKIIPKSRRRLNPQSTFRAELQTISTDPLEIVGPRGYCHFEPGKGVCITFPRLVRYPSRFLTLCARVDYTN
jgi:hypothetical protein